MLWGRGWQKYSSANCAISSMDDDLGLKGKHTSHQETFDNHQQAKKQEVAGDHLPVQEECSVFFGIIKFIIVESFFCCIRSEHASRFEN